MEGDRGAISATLLTIIDPVAMQLEAAVPADSLQDIRVGTPIEFHVQGFEGKVFVGRIARVNPQADPATRQIKVFAEPSWCARTSSATSRWGRTMSPPRTKGPTRSAWRSRHRAVAKETIAE